MNNIVGSSEDFEEFVRMDNHHACSEVPRIDMRENLRGARVRMEHICDKVQESTIYWYCYWVNRLGVRLRHYGMLHSPTTHPCLLSPSAYIPMRRAIPLTCGGTFSEHMSTRKPFELDWTWDVGATTLFSWIATGKTAWFAAVIDWVIEVTWHIFLPMLLPSDVSSVDGQWCSTLVTWQGMKQKQQECLLREVDTWVECKQFVLPWCHWQSITRARCVVAVWEVAVRATSRRRDTRKIFGDSILIPTFHP